MTCARALEALERQAERAFGPAARRDAAAVRTPLAAQCARFEDVAWCALHDDGFVGARPGAEQRYEAVLSELNKLLIQASRLHTQF